MKTQPNQQPPKHTMSASVNKNIKDIWVQVYIGSKESGTPIKIKPVPDDIHDLKEAVKAKLVPDLDYCAPNKLFVYPTGTDVSVLKGVEALDADRELSFPTSATTKNDEPGPLIVVAPLQEQVS